MEISFVSNRELRVIPKGWVHPARKALFPAGDFPATEEAQRAYLDEYETDGLPSRDEYMPDVEGLRIEQTEIMAYETTSEGTPISPAFPNTPEGRLALTEYCAANASTFADFKADAETWAAILFGDTWAIVTEGRTEVHIRGEHQS